MWRLWTKGWGVRAWWYWVCENWPYWVANRLPREVALRTFIRVYAWDGQAPGPEYTRIYRAWVAGEAGRYQPATVPPGFVGEGSTAMEFPRQWDVDAALEEFGDARTEIKGKITPLEWGEHSYSKGDAFAVQFGGQPDVSALGYNHYERPDPTVFDLADPRFDVLWNRLKHLEITGNDIAGLLRELDAAGVCPSCGKALAGSFPKCIDCQLVDALKDGH
jgi:hypothetical protein